MADSTPRPDYDVSDTCGTTCVTRPLTPDRRCTSAAETTTPPAGDLADAQPHLRQAAQLVFLPKFKCVDFIAMASPDKPLSHFVCESTAGGPQLFGQVSNDP